MKLEFTKEEHRENLILMVSSLVSDMNQMLKTDYDALPEIEHIDKYLCEEMLDIDRNENPPLFLLHP
jgi:hypothetical protein